MQFYHSSYTRTFVLVQRTSKSDYLSVLIVQTSLITLETPPVFVKCHKNQVARHCTAFTAIVRLRLLDPTDKIQGMGLIMEMLCTIINL